MSILAAAVTCFFRVNYSHARLFVYHYIDTFVTKISG